LDRLLLALAGEGHFDSALSIATQLAGEAISRPWLGRRILALGTAALSDAKPTDHMVHYYLSELVSKGVFTPDDLLELWDAAMATFTGQPSDLARVITVKALDVAAEQTLTHMIGLIRVQAEKRSALWLFAARQLPLLGLATDKLGAESVWQRIAQLDSKEFRIAVHYMRWGGDKPDALTERFLSSARLEGYESEARSAFYNTLGFVAGPYWIALERERDRAAAWRAALTSPTGERWADDLVRAYENDIAMHKVREAEEDFTLGL
jgi:hypothetical protein